MITNTALNNSSSLQGGPVVRCDSSISSIQQQEQQQQLAGDRDSQQEGGAKGGVGSDGCLYESESASVSGCVEQLGRRRGAIHRRQTGK